jgi:hypothetical protein
MRNLVVVHHEDTQLQNKQSKVITTKQHKLRQATKQSKQSEKANARCSGNVWEKPVQSISAQSQKKKTI